MTVFVTNIQFLKLIAYKINKRNLHNSYQIKDYKWINQNCLTK
jgi:hypothetical protein